MKKLYIGLFAVLVFPITASAALPHIGFYQTIDDETNLPKSIVALYEYQDDSEINVAGRIVALYGADGTVSETLSAPVRVADAVPSAPKMVGLDIIWDMEWDSDDSEYSDGKIMDPKTGKVYSSVMWAKDNKVLNVRGKIGPFGRTQHWNVLDAETLPVDLKGIDMSSWTPKLHKK